MMDMILRKSISVSFLATALLISQSAIAAEAPELPGWTLVWHDEFDGPDIDTTAWEILDLRDSQNNEKQYYLADNVTIVDGMLRITATDEPMDRKPYRSGRLWTHAGWTHGRFESRAKLPSTQGMWPAIWLLPRDIPWPSGGEIDIMENRGSEPNQVSSAYHWGENWEKHQYESHHHKSLTTNEKPTNFHDSYHIYAVEWEPDTIRFYVDGVLHFTVTEEEAPIHDTSMSVVLNLAVGGFFGGDPDSSTKFPQELDIDYVRVWQKSAPLLEESDEIPKE